MVEIDTEVHRRKQIVQKVRNLTVDLKPEPGLAFTELLDRAGTIIDQFLRPLAKLSKPEGRDALEDLLAAAVAVDQLVLDTSVPLPRPHLRVGRLLHESCVLVDDCLDRFLDALGAETLLLAQQIGAEAQLKLDAAARRIGDLRQAQEELQSLMTADDDGFYELMAQRVMAGTTDGLLGADRLGRDFVQLIIGPDEVPQDGAGLGVLWASIYAQVFFDFDRFCALAATLYRLLQQPGEFDALASDTDWRTWHKRAHSKLADSGETLRKMLAVAEHDHEAVRAVLLYVQDTFEGACKHFAATILAQLGTGSYAEHMEHRQRRPLVHYLRDNSMSHDLAVGLLGPLRNASGHNDFEVRDELIALDLGPSETQLTDAQFADAALLFAESAMALSLAFEIALLQRGTPTSLEDTRSLLSAEEMLRLLVASAGLTCVEVDLTGDTITLRGNGRLVAPMPTVGALLLSLPPTAKTLRLIWQDHGRDRCLTVPVGLTRAHSRCPDDTLKKELAFMELAHVTTLDDERFLTRAGFRHSVALKAGAVVTGTPSEFGTRFRMLRDLCSRVGDDDFAETLRLVMRAQRLIAMKEVPDLPARQAIDDLAEWEKKRVPMPFRD